MNTETKKAPSVAAVGHYKINDDGSREGTIIGSARWPEIVKDAGLTGQWMELVLVPAGEARDSRDWSLLEATQESLREHSQMLRDRDARIAELEAQVKQARDAALKEVADALGKHARHCGETVYPPKYVEGVLGAADHVRQLRREARRLRDGGA